MEFVELRITCANCSKNNTVVLSSNPDCEPLCVCGVCGKALFEYRVISGYIYVLSNPQMPGVLKIGFTTRRVEERVQELSAAAGVPAPFVIEACFASPDPQKHEYDIYQKVQNHRVGNKEFFELDLRKALSEIEAIIGAPPHYVRQPWPPGTEIIESHPKTESITKITKFYCSKCKGEWLANYLLERCPSCARALQIR